MAGESVDSFIIPGKTEDGPEISKSHRRASIGTFNDGDGSKNKSAQKSISAVSNRNVVPNYLRASTGSCHDFCKHGKVQTFEEKAKKPLRKRIAKPSPDELPVLIVVSSEKNKEKSVVNHKPQIDTKNPSPDSKSFSPKLKIDMKNPSPDKKEVIKNKPSIHTKKPHSPEKITHLRKHENPSDAKNKPVLLKRTPLTTTKDFHSPYPSEIVKSVCFSSNKDEDNKMRVKSKPVKAKPLLSSSDNLDGLRGKEHKNSESNPGQNKTKTSQASAKKVSAATTRSVTPRAVTPRAATPRAATSSAKLPIIKTSRDDMGKAGNVKSVSYPKDRNRIRTVNKNKTPDNEKVPEKIVHVVETENKNNIIEPVSSVESLSHENSSVLSSHEEDNDAAAHSDEVNSKNESLEIIGKVPPVKENIQNKTLKKTKVVVSEDNNKNRTPVKVKFRNGKVMDVQSSNSNLPRKLRFRRARVIGADEIKSDLRRRIFKKAGVSDHKAGGEDLSHKIVLKHQDVPGKKDGPGLLNNDIIEQTASKLVESRKSKVKALVGAFETVISLQESKHFS